MYRLKPLIDGSLLRLRRTPSNLPVIMEACMPEQARLCRKGFRRRTYRNRLMSSCAHGLWTPDASQAVSARHACAAGDRGDGNCLFRACLAMTTLIVVLRLFAATEVGLRPETYSSDSPTKHGVSSHPMIVWLPFTEVFHELTTVGADSCVVSGCRGFICSERGRRLLLSSRFIRYPTHMLRPSHLADVDDDERCARPDVLASITSCRLLRVHNTHTRQQQQTLDAVSQVVLYNSIGLLESACRRLPAIRTRLQRPCQRIVAQPTTQLGNYILTEARLI